MQEAPSKISPEWQNWIHESLERGCHLQTIMETMASNKFDPVAALGYVFSEIEKIPAESAVAGDLNNRLRQIPKLSPEWKRWVTEMLAHGQTTHTILQCMLKNKVNPISALLFVHSEAGKKSSPQTGAAALNTTSEQDHAKTTLKHAESNSESTYDYSNPRFSHTGNVIRAHDRDVRIRLHLTRPGIAVFDNVLSDEECEGMIELARSRMARSSVVDALSGESRESSYRTSSGTFFQSHGNDLLLRIEQRVAALMQMPVAHGEDFQVLRYDVGQEYKEHHDYFDPRDPAVHRLLKVGGQRVSTLLLYLNDVPRGGETLFHKLGLSVVPKKGSALYFEYCNSLGQLDPMTLHGGAPVIEGEKWVATKWMRYRPYR